MSIQKQKSKKNIILPVSASNTDKNIFFKTQTKILDKHNIIYQSIDIALLYDEKEKKLKKKPNFVGMTYKNVKVKTSFDINKSGLIIPLGEIYGNLIGVDVDNKNGTIDFFANLAKEHKYKLQTLTVKTINDGYHYYFRLNDVQKVALKNFTASTGRCFTTNEQQRNIDIKYNNQIFFGPSYLSFENNIHRYKIDLDKEPAILPEYLFNEIVKATHEEIIKMPKPIKEISQKNDIPIEFIEINDEDMNHDFTDDDIIVLLNMLSEYRCNDYQDWLNVGICLYNINIQHLHLWNTWSKKSNKYKDDICKEKWKGFKKDKNGLKIGSLLLWCKMDNLDAYTEFLKQKKVSNLIVSKFPNNKLQLGKTTHVNNHWSTTQLNNNECFIKGTCHNDYQTPMYIEKVKDLVAIKCKHPECFNKSYPNNTCIQLTKQEMNIFNVTININNNKDDELVDFQQINLYENDELNLLVFNGLNGKSNSLADIIFYFYKDIFNYGEDENWYYFNNHKWENIGRRGSQLRKLLRPKLKEIYTVLLSYYKNEAPDFKKMNAITFIMNSFDDVNLKNSIMSELIDIYSNASNPHHDFVKKLDMNKYLIGFNNGVYDLKTFEFRSGKPTDLITMSVGYDYTDKHTDKNNDLLQFLHDIQPIKEDYEYMMTYLSIALVGNILELFAILTGKGRNGKSKLIQLLKETFGNYFASVSSQMLTRPRPNAESPDPGLLNLLKKKLVIASEPEKNAKLNCGFIKFITGRDSTTLRNCHQNEMVEFIANFILLFICNDIPECDDMDNAMCLRVRCHNFPSEFVTNPINENQKKINEFISDNFVYWRIDFMLLLIEYYKKYQQTKILVPSNNIMKWTNQYKQNTCIFLCFLDENTHKSESDIHCSHLYDSFKEWFRTNNPTTKIPNNKDFINGISKYHEVKKIRIDNTILRGIKNLSLNINLE